MTQLLTLKSLNIHFTIQDGVFQKMVVIKQIMYHIFPCNADKNKATNKKYTSNERKLYTFHEKIPNTG